MRLRTISPPKSSSYSRVTSKYSTSQRPSGSSLWNLTKRTRLQTPIMSPSSASPKSSTTRTKFWTSKRKWSMSSRSSKFNRMVKCLKLTATCLKLWCLTLRSKSLSTRLILLKISCSSSCFKGFRPKLTEWRGPMYLALRRVRMFRIRKRTLKRIPRFLAKMRESLLSRIISLMPLWQIQLSKQLRCCNHLWSPFKRMLLDKRI